MAKKHFSALKEICQKEGILQAVKYHLDRSHFRLLIPYPSEVLPGMLAVDNYHTLMVEAIGKKDDKFTRIIKRTVSGMLSFGWEGARYVATVVTYNETKSIEAAILAYSLSSSFFSVRNQFRTDRFYESKELTDRLEPA